MIRLFLNSRGNAAISVTRMAPIFNASESNAALTAGVEINFSAMAAFKVSDIDPDIGDAGKPAKITNLSGVGFLPGLSVSLRKGDKTIEGEDVKVIQQTKATCVFDIPQDSELGKWHVVAINPDGATSSLRERFTIISGRPLKTAADATTRDYWNI